jgi:hypothetical protein
MEPHRAEHPTEKVISPFAQSEAIISKSKGSGGKLLLIVGAGLLLVVIGAVVAVAAMRYLNDPYRTLETFPVSKYLDDYQALAGSKYKANFRVEADLGWKEGAGRPCASSCCEWHLFHQRTNLYR